MKEVAGFAQAIDFMERETGVEPATSSLGSWHSTTELLPLRSLDQVSQNQVLTRKGGTSLMQKPGSTSQESDANVFSSLEWSRIGLASKMDSKTHHYIGRLRARKGAAGVATYAPFYPAGARVPWEISDDMVLRTSRRFHLDLFGGWSTSRIGRRREIESIGPIWLGVNR